MGDLWTPPTTWTSGHQPSSDRMNKEWRDNLTVLSSEEWVNATLLNSWVAYGGAYVGARYRRKGGVTTIEAVIKNGNPNNNVVIFVLPNALAPRFPQMCYAHDGLANSGYVNVFPPNTLIGSEIVPYASVRIGENCQNTSSYVFSGSWPSSNETWHSV